MIRAEPALLPIRARLAGGILYPGDGSGDAHGFTLALAERAERAGVAFRWRSPVRGFARDGDRLRALALDDGALAADAFVLAAGAFSPLLARQLGLRLPVRPAKASLTVRVPGWNAGPKRPIADDGRKAGLVPLGERIRVAGTVEFAGWDDRPSPARLRMLEATLADLLPAMPRPAAPPEPWAGLRPLTPDGPPLLGRTRLANLVLNTGHGPLGWTLACGSALLLADLLDGRPPALDPAPYAWPRPTG